MIDLHSHTIFSDGELIISELACRAKNIGYTAIGITDHVDYSNYKFVAKGLLESSEKLNKLQEIKIIPGAEITHVPPKLIGSLTEAIRKEGIKLIVVHGETPVEPVEKGTNRAAILAKVNILAHPGLITEEDINLAVKNNVYLEITSRKGHCLANGYVAKLAQKYNAKLLINSDTHSPTDLLLDEFAKTVVLCSGLNETAFQKMQQNAKEIIEACI